MMALEKMMGLERTKGKGKRKKEREKKREEKEKRKIKNTYIKVKYILNGLTGADANLAIDEFASIRGVGQRPTPLKPKKGPKP